MRHTLCRALFKVFGHHICCPRIPEWTAYIGFKWEGVYESRRSYFNLYNAIWLAANWVRGGIEA